ncbi:MAG: ester cyclase [Alphaproteobacteria bacterium]|jgi:steroid delta-isomerase-like uncharacterized protein
MSARQALAALVLASAFGAPALAGEDADCASETRAANAATVRIVFEEILGKGRIDENEHIYHPDFVVHGPTRDYSRAEDRAASQGWRQASPDMAVSVLQTVAACDTVAVHYEVSGTNSGEGNGLPATGRPYRVRGMTVFGLRDGLIAEEWTVFDQYGMLKQLGLLPS